MFTTRTFTGICLQPCPTTMLLYPRVYLAVPARRANGQADPAISLNKDRKFSVVVAELVDYKYPQDPEKNGQTMNVGENDEVYHGLSVGKDGMKGF